ncbi:uncharacterized protein BP01DRAFT_291292 [Aspergillus saccharolyticus JOP 1030-1]|uniref:Uncharacterized protein n=1 Tax=Aspergillus saccharolyticus JOP 1030-1 TaxID=1450539 RepID=A0A318ZLR7_9EURO|nr:hypothetical protein BP01DRAFT_291292 [Aspergillus saccharolyticus JOP 1030-1]PYH47384.1 hypothetical protein BP01DRAFT_291292 [Aspergillus saccharolyticus JOP 1030-1]
MSSSNYYPSSPRFAPPQSAQPYQSIFGGGDSSQDAGNASESERDADAAAAAADDDRDGGDLLDTIMEEDELPPLGETFSDESDFTYMDSGGEESDDEGDGAVRNDAVQEQTDMRIAKPRRQQQAPRAPSSSPSADEYRPNRFRGLESTWRKLTAEDRQNAQALIDLRARDLSAHLYNAYALRVRARAMARRVAAGGRGQETRNADDEEEEVFAPPKRWTAWPMPAAEVPRPGELIRRAVDDVWTLRQQPDPRPSAELEESLMAVMLKTAKERFNARQWETRPATDAMTPRRRRKSSMSQTGTGTGTQEESAADWDSEDIEEQETTKPVTLRPVVQADDEKSHMQLRPLTRNILTQFDTLLMGLYRARQGDLARDDDSSVSEWQTDTASVGSGASSAQSQKRKGKERSRSRGRKRTRRSSSTRLSSSRGASSERISSPATTSSQRSRSQGSSQSRGRSHSSDGRRSVSRVRLGLRDWSEVLGIASMTGFPAAVVMRASRRCADLFGQDMAFRTFHEGKVRQEVAEDGALGPWEYVESESDSEADPEVEQPEPEPESVPVSRASSKRPRSRATSVKGGSRSRATSASADDTVRPKGKGEHRKADLVCPIRSCDRHHNGFSRRWNLNQHLKTMHPNYQPSPSARKTSAATTPK